MNHTESDFWQAIIANPGDFQLRLVYADWLDDHSRPGADVLRRLDIKPIPMFDDPNPPVNVDGWVVDGATGPWHRWARMKSAERYLLRCLGAELRLPIPIFTTKPFDDPDHRLCYVLDSDGNVFTADFMNWAIWMDNRKNRMVVRTDLPDDVQVSTCFLGINHSFGRGATLLFETMIFGGGNDGYQDRYPTLTEAEVGHLATVERAMD